MMKKMIMALAAAVMMSSTVLAQDNSKERRREGKADRTEMVKKRTDETVKRYGLNEEQAAKLLDLNTRYAGKMAPRGPRFDGRQGQGKHNPDSMKQKKQRPQLQEEMEGQPKQELEQGAQQKERRHPGMRRGNNEQMKKEMEAYDAELKQIMTEEQYKAYRADWEKRMKEGPRGKRPQRQEN